MKLIADAMLGRLARWLRALGHDVIYDEALDDAALARRARGEGRLLLTRDRRLCAEQREPEGPLRCRVLDTQKPRAQLRELAGPLGLFDAGWRHRLFTRCMVCNAALESATYDDVEDRLPRDVRPDPRVRSAEFRRCPACRRVYWEGSHTRRMRRWLEQVAAAD